MTSLISNIMSMTKFSLTNLRFPKRNEFFSLPVVVVVVVVHQKERRPRSSIRCCCWRRYLGRPGIPWRRRDRRPWWATWPGRSPTAAASCSGRSRSRSCAGCSPPGNQKTPSLVPCLEILGVIQGGVVSGGHRVCPEE